MSERHLTEREKHVRKKIELALEQKREKHRLNMLRRRIEMARDGLAAFNDKKYPEASRSFAMYIRILEDWKKIASGTLNPSHFDIRKDLAELLLISSVYWHLVKLSDKAKGPAGERQFRHFMAQFILFSRGMTFTPLAAETLRKYMRAANLDHAKEFKAAYKVIANNKCFIVTELDEHLNDKTLPLLRSFRDQTLLLSPFGKAFVAFYYRVGPIIAGIVGRAPLALRLRIAQILDRIAQKIGS